MTTKEKIKRQIDNMPEDLLEQVDKFIRSLKRRTKSKKFIKTYKLKGRFDNINIRERAYE